MTTNHRAPTKYTIAEFLRELLWCHDTYDEGFPGPEHYTKRQLMKLARDAMDLLEGFRCWDCARDTSDEYYVVHDAIWDEHIAGEGMLCIGCLETRLGRQLRPQDFADCGANRMDGKSDRLKDRLGGAA